MCGAAGPPKSSPYWPRDKRQGLVSPWTHCCTITIETTTKRNFIPISKRAQPNANKGAEMHLWRGRRLNVVDTAAISSIRRGFDHLPRALSQPGFRLDHCENGQMVCLSLCNYFDADDRDWLFATRLDERAQREPRHADARAGWMARPDAINLLDTFNKRPDE